MNRRSALLAAAGIVLSMVIAVAAVVAGLAGPDAASASGPARSAPRVRTITRTITAHRPADVVTTFSDDGSFDDDGDDVAEDRSHGDDDGWEHEDDHGDDHEDDGGHDD